MELETERLLLREFVDDDWSAAHDYERDPEVARYQTFEPRSPEESLEYIRRNIAARDDLPRRTWDMAVALRVERRLIGRVGLHVAHPTHREGALWYVLHRAQWGRGYAPEAARALLRFGFGPLGLHRITLETDPRNRASVRVAEKLGMRLEAHFVESFWHKGGWTDSLVFGLLDREWRPADS